MYILSKGPKNFSKKLRRLLSKNVKDSKTVPTKETSWLKKRRESLVIKVKSDLERKKITIVMKEIIQGNIFNSTVRKLYFS